MTTFMWNANPTKWDVVPPTTSGWDALKEYLLDVSSYVYWSTPVHQNRISVGDRAFIWRTASERGPSGIIASGRVEEAPQQLSATFVSSFSYPTRVSAPGWAEASARSIWKTGLRIERVYWNKPLQVNFAAAQGTLRRLTEAEVKNADDEAAKR